MKRCLRSAFLLACCTLVIGVHATVRDSATFTNVTPAQALDAGAGTLRTATFANTGYTLGRVYFSGTLQEINTTTGDFASDNRMRVTLPGGQFTEVTLSSMNSYSGTIPFNGSFFVGPGLVPPYGGAWQFRFVNIVDDNPFGFTDANILSINIQLSDDAPTATAPTSENLGTVGGSGTSITRSFSAGQVQWFRFRIGEATSGTKYLDIDTEGSTIVNQDTEIALYDAYGVLIAEDDDNGSVLLSQLTFGPNATVRLAIGTGAPGDGHHGTLPAGTYYLAVSTWNATFAPDFVASTNSTDTGSVTINFRTNLTAIPATVTGFVDLQNYLPDEAGEQVTMEIRPVGSTSPLQVATITLGAGGSYTLNVSDTITPGTYDVVCKGRTWLRQKASSVLFGGAGAAGLNFSLNNGDCDGDNQVNSDDFDILVAGFGLSTGQGGFDPRADLNGDGTADSDDFDILIASFGSTGNP